MTRIRQRWLVVAGVCLLLCPAAAGARKSAWEKFNAAGLEALNEGRLSKAEKKFLAALKKAEGFGTQDPRLATSLNNLAELYREQGKYAEAEPLHQRALAIREKALGPEHPDVATSLETYANFLRKMERDAEAEQMEARAKAIRSKMTQEPR